GLGIARGTGGAPWNSVLISPARSIAIESALRTLTSARVPLRLETARAPDANDGPLVTVREGSDLRRSIAETVPMYEPSISPLSRPEVRVFSSGTPKKLMVFTLAGPFQ